MMVKRIFTKEAFVIEVTIEPDGDSILVNVETILGGFRARFTLKRESILELAAALEKAARGDSDE